MVIRDPSQEICGVPSSVQQDQQFTAGPLLALWSAYECDRHSRRRGARSRRTTRGEWRRSFRRCAAGIRRRRSSSSLARSRAYRLAIGIIRNAQDAEEVVQDAFWNVIRKIDLFREDSGLRTWIYRVVNNAARHKRRTFARRPAHIDPERRTALRLALTAAIETLPGDYQTAAEIADVLGVAVMAD